MANYNLPPIHTVPEVSDEAFLQIIDALFEPNDTIHTIIETAAEISRSLKLRKYISYDELIEETMEFVKEIVYDVVYEDNGAMIDDILQAHPRLGAKMVESAQSQAEQAQLKKGGEVEAKKLAILNEKYEKTFPGLRYVVFVNGRSREEIMKNMRARIDRGDTELERDDALQAMVDIAKDRARKLQQA